MGRSGAMQRSTTNGVRRGTAPAANVIESAEFAAAVKEIVEAYRSFDLLDAPMSAEHLLLTALDEIGVEAAVPAGVVRGDFDLAVAGERIDIRAARSSTPGRPLTVKLLALAGRDLEQVLERLQLKTAAVDRLVVLRQEVDRQKLRVSLLSLRPDVLDALALLRPSDFNEADDRHVAFADLPVANAPAAQVVVDFRHGTLSLRRLTHELWTPLVDVEL